MVRKHTKLGHGCQDNYTAVRVLHYPPLPPDFDFGLALVSEEDQTVLRKCEHVDYGSLTLLFPDPKIGGLQVHMSYIIVEPQNGGAYKYAYIKCEGGGGLQVVEPQGL